MIRLDQSKFRCIRCTKRDIRLCKYYGTGMFRDTFKRICHRGKKKRSWQTKIYEAHFSTPQNWPSGPAKPIGMYSRITHWHFQVCTLKCSFKMRRCRRKTNLIYHAQVQDILKLLTSNLKKCVDEQKNIKVHPRNFGIENSKLTKSFR